MYRGTTPTLNFTLPFSCSSITKLDIAFSQCGKIIFEKKLPDCITTSNVLSVTLTEEDTLSLNCNYELQMQIRCYCGSTKLASNIMKTTVGKILKEGTL